MRGCVHPLGESFDCAGVDALLAEVLAGDVDVGLLSGSGDGDVYVLLVGLPAAGEDLDGLGCESLALADVHRVGEGDVRELLVLTSCRVAWAHGS